MREKLYELLHVNVCEYPVCDECEYCEDEDACISYMEHKVADHLIANGVIIPVRCKDCERRSKSADLTYTIYCPWLGHQMDKTDFCSYGERKEGDG